MYMAACGLKAPGTKGGRLQCREREGHVSTAINVKVVRLLFAERFVHTVCRGDLVSLFSFFCFHLMFLPH